MNTLLILFFLHGGDHGRHCGTVVGFIFSVVTPGYGVLARMLYSTVVCNVHLVHCDSCWRKWCQNSCWRQRADEAFVFEGCVRVRRVWHSKDFFLFNGAKEFSIPLVAILRERCCRARRNKLQREHQEGLSTGRLIALNIWKARVPRIAPAAERRNTHSQESALAAEQRADALAELRKAQANACSCEQ